MATSINGGAQTVYRFFGTSQLTRSREEQVEVKQKTEKRAAEQKESTKQEEVRYEEQKQQTAALEQQALAKKEKARAEALISDQLRKMEQQKLNLLAEQQRELGRLNSFRLSA